MDGDGLVEGGGEGMEWVGDLGKWGEMGMEEFAADELGEGVKVLVKLLELLLSGERVGGEG